MAGPLLQCEYTCPSQSRILLLPPKSWCSLHWCRDAGFLHHNMLHHELQSKTYERKIKMGENRWTLHSIRNGSDKLTGRPKLCQLPTNSIQGHSIMYDSVCFGIYKSPFRCHDFGYFLAVKHLLRVIIHILRVIVHFLRVITYFLRVTVPAYCMTHIIPTVESGNIGNILLLKGPINLSFFLSPFRPPIVLDVHHVIPIPFQIHITTCHAPSPPSKRRTQSEVLRIWKEEILFNHWVITVIDDYLAKSEM